MPSTPTKLCGVVDRLAVEPQLQPGGIRCERDRGLAWPYVAAHRARESARIRDPQVEPVEDVRPRSRPCVGIVNEPLFDPRHAACADACASHGAGRPTR